jgi:DNA invertase Pin-like site-specific DNA recombinase
MTNPSPASPEGTDPVKKRKHHYTRNEAARLIEEFRRRQLAEPTLTQTRFAREKHISRGTFNGWLKRNPPTERTTLYTPQEAERVLKDYDQLPPSMTQQQKVRELGVDTNTLRRMLEKREAIGKAKTGKSYSFSPTQISEILQEIDALVAQGATLISAVKSKGISKSTYYQWKKSPPSGTRSVYNIGEKEDILIDLLNAQKNGMSVSGFARQRGIDNRTLRAWRNEPDLVKRAEEKKARAASATSRVSTATHAVDDLADTIESSHESEPGHLTPRSRSAPSQPSEDLVEEVSLSSDEGESPELATPLPRTPVPPRGNIVGEIIIDSDEETEEETEYAGSDDERSAPEPGSATPVRTTGPYPSGNVTTPTDQPSQVSARKRKTPDDSGDEQGKSPRLSKGSKTSSYSPVRDEKRSPQRGSPKL